MAPVYDQLASEYSTSEHVMIADVNCGEEDALCEANDVRGYPTIKYYVNGVENNYEGGRSYEDLKVRGSEERSDVLTTKSSDENHTCSYFRAIRASPVNTAIILIPHPNPFRDSLRSSQGFVEETMAVKCDIERSASTCSEKAIRYISKWSFKGNDDIRKEVGRLEGMMRGRMKGELKNWVGERVGILKQIHGGEEL